MGAFYWDDLDPAGHGKTCSQCGNPLTYGEKVFSEETAEGYATYCERCFCSIVEDKLERDSEGLAESLGYCVGVVDQDGEIDV